MDGGAMRGLLIVPGIASADCCFTAIAMELYQQRQCSRLTVARLLLGGGITFWAALGG